MTHFASVRTAEPLPLVRDDERTAQICHREMSFSVRSGSIDEAARTVELSFSSEEPYARWWGIEILDHAEKSVDLGRLNSGGALLMDHDTRDLVGVVEKAWVKGKRAFAIVRFGKSARAQEIFQDVLDGIRKLVSVGYRHVEVVLEKADKDGEVYRVTKWEPYEISLVSVPADPTVGVGRDGETPAFDPRNLIHEEEEDMNMRRDAAGAAAPAPVAPAPVAVAPAAVVETRSASVPAQAAPDTAALDAARNEERLRIANLRAMGARLECAELAERAIADGRSVDQFISEYTVAAGAASAIRTAESPEIGMSGREVARFSFVRLMNALANPNDRAAQNAAGFELECSAAARRNVTAQEQRGERIPLDVLRGGLQRDLTAGVAADGGNTVATNLLAGSFIEMLRNAMALPGLGARMLTDLSGNIAIPAQTGGATAYWVAENAAPTESQQVFGQVALTPKTVAGFTDFSRRLLLQSSIDIENFVRADLASVLGLAIDLAAINGSGASNQPRGILNTAGIGSEVGGTNGAAATWANIINLETKVAVANAPMASMAYLTNAKVRGALKQTQQFAGTSGAPVWSSSSEMNGYRAVASNQVPWNLTKGTSAGVCSAILFGNWSELMVGMWGGLDLMVDPYTNSTTGGVRIVAFQDVDVAVRHAASFAAMVDALAV